jgi:GAF domain-containing protein
MIKAPIPPDEEERLAALHALLILDTPPEERFDRIVSFMAAEFDVPVALITLVDRDRVWFKSKFGLSACEAGRDSSFCGHAIVVPELCVVPDMLQDSRFADHPMVAGEPGLRMYAGAPLLMHSGHVAGMLCMNDTRVRDFDELDYAILFSLRDLVVAELERAPGTETTEPRRGQD